MVVVRLHGGLGNQMFQYAAGKALSLKRNEQLKIDISMFKTYKLRSYELSVFQSINHKSIVMPCIIIRFYKLLAKICRRIAVVLDDKNDLINMNIKTNNIFLDGYWQSDKFFDAYSSEIRGDLTLCADILNDIEKTILDEINEANSVSVHVRRGDYVTKQGRMVYYECDSEYYSAAQSLINRFSSNPKFYVFSDDIEWVKDNIDFKYSCEYVELSKERSSAITMLLMSRCKHNIIANSSFSWWSAWINSNKDKIVVAPKQWFVDGRKTKNQIIPKEWYTI